MDSGRAHALGRLADEKRQALGCFEYVRAAELQAQIDELSRGSQRNPAAEQAARPRPSVSTRKPPARRPARPPRKGT